MRRWLTIFLLLLLPLQFSWAAAGRYCLHEKITGASHFGHHEHEHEASTADQAAASTDADTQETVTKLFGDDDCAYCHLGAAKPVLSEPAAPAAATGDKAPQGPGVLPIRTRGPDRLERPNWRIA
jgi:hypothetical protein